MRYLATRTIRFGKCYRLKGKEIYPQVLGHSQSQVNLVYMVMGDRDSDKDYLNPFRLVRL